MIYAGDFRHGLDRHFDFTHVSVLNEVVYRRKILLNRMLDILERLLFSLALRPASWQARAGNAITFLALL